MAGLAIAFLLAVALCEVVTSLPARRSAQVGDGSAFHFGLSPWLGGAGMPDCGAELPIPAGANRLPRNRPRILAAVAGYPRQPGAFVDLATDLAWLSGLRLADFVMDEHLTLAFEPRTGEGLIAASAINQAVGVLIGQGHTPDEARRQLEERPTAPALT